MNRPIVLDQYLIVTDLPLDAHLPLDRKIELIQLYNFYPVLTMPDGILYSEEDQ